ncbi:TPA: type 1 glutamine amidotransferase domain-containing protein [Streptococcus suis]|uniref:type 1 glutamine amidotransferase domain-containing protein n=1 Tax=Streptococcus suis TaxID=1307 RepID=UPI001557DBE5|nr:DJ-1/PfpI family protein [Streptococcus suis]MDY7594088.1 type 1 glutamine amidotransferase domain-containing protein [Streptococcus suis]NQQ29164.1 type 1 glutamine amidotransferase domain-containing protein [Streptococcus suis]HEL2254431.1 type 1 glutamine amidotransferase domain-containing protein [Streptococcus suis]HEL2298547.1 type 1 glutamine amidotransferase domain-containing protein [Streptococcus suis]HEL2405310.1 type 1 glutamine amidotransferase domain-containing protein [Strept
MKKALIVLTNIEQYGEHERLTGLWLSELTHFYDELVKAGYDADFVSPKGGYVPLDPHSLTTMDDVDRTYYKNADFRNRALGQTLRPEEVKATDYKLIYYTGGHGVMWDFPESVEIAELASQIYQNGGIVTAVCHGVAGLLPIKDENGQPLIEGKVVTGFTNQEEELNGTADLVPFLTETALREKGAKVEIGTAFSPVVRQDDRILTGQNPQSARALGQTVVSMLTN